MTLAVADLQRLSSLLDEALDLPAAEHARWLDALPDEARPLAGTLRNLLARHAEAETGDFTPAPQRWLARGPERVAEAAAGAMVGPYRLIRELGTGGMGAVWLAERGDGLLDRKVALKLPHVGWTPGFAQRFARERAILATLEHPHIARLYDAGVDEFARPYMALEYVEGEAIDAFCRRRALDLRSRVELLLQVAEAVAFAHARLVVHRDIKPANILVTTEGQVRLLDFGIAKLIEGDAAEETELTRAAGRALTPHYASPEQIRGGPIGTASDVYSLGVVAFELLAGVRPQRGRLRGTAALEEAMSPDEAPLASAVAEDPVLRRQLRGDLDAILAKALKEAPGERYATVDALAQDWRRHLAGERVFARRDSVLFRLARLGRRHRVPLVAGFGVVAAFGLTIGAGATALVIVALVAGLAAALWQSASARRQAALARQAADQSRRETQRAQAVQGFLLDIFRANTIQQADPLKAQCTTARELLDIGAERIGEALKDAPEAQLEVRGTLCDMYIQLGLRVRARELHRGSVDIARAVFGPRSVKLADALLGYVNILHESPERSRVPALLEEAMRALDGPEEQTTFLRSAALLERARYYRYETLHEARETADEAVAHFLAHHPQRASLVTAHWVAALARTAALDGAAAEPHVRAAVEAARQRGAAAPAWMIGPLTGLAEAQELQMRYEDAEANLREAEALALRTHGERHRETLLTRTKLANLLFTLGRRDEATPLHESVRTLLADPDPRWGEQELLLLRGLWVNRWPERGRPDLAEAVQRAEVEDLRRQAPRGAGTALCECRWAATLLMLGRLDEAEDVLAQATKRWAGVARGEAVPADAAFAHVAAELALARGDTQQALERCAGLQRAAPLDRMRLDLVQAQAWLALGRSQLARTAAQGVLDALGERASAWRPKAVEAAAHCALGRALALQGDVGGSRAAWEAALALREAHDESGSLHVAQVRKALATIGPAAPQALR